MSKADQDSPLTFWKLATFVFLIMAAFFAISSWLLPDLAERGQFGDSFGAVNALFSGLAFAGLISALFLQRNELQLQREELRLTRNELAAQSAAQTAHAQVALKTAAINALAALLSLHKQRFDSYPPGANKREHGDKLDAAQAQMEALLREVAR